MDLYRHGKKRGRPFAVGLVASVVASGGMDLSVEKVQQPFAFVIWLLNLKTAVELQEQENHG